MEKLSGITDSLRVVMNLVGQPAFEKHTPGPETQPGTRNTLWDQDKVLLIGYMVQIFTTNLPPSNVLHISSSSGSKTNINCNANERSKFFFSILPIRLFPM